MWPVVTLFVSLAARRRADSAAIPEARRSSAASAVGSTCTATTAAKSHRAASHPPPRRAPSVTPGEPNEQTLGVSVYPGSQFITSYDAGRGQRYYLFGTTAGFAEIVAYYRTLLKQRGEVVFELPPIHMFEVGRFREETMAFPPGVTVKDYTWGGSEGYINPKRGAQPTHFRTVIQIVPAPAGAAK